MNKKTLPVLMTCWQRKGGNKPPTIVSLDNGRLDPTAEVSVHLPGGQEKRVLEAGSCLPQAELRKDLHKWLSRFCQHQRLGAAIVFCWMVTVQCWVLRRVYLSPMWRVISTDP